MTPTARLRFESTLGQGGMGDVYLAQLVDGTSSRWVAVKRIRAAFADDPAMKARFEREARVSALLRHPNIVSTLEYGADHDGPYLVLEYIEGHSAVRLLSRVVLHGKTLPLDAALSILVDVADGLTCAHEYVNEDFKIHGIVHRDITPDNILVGYDGIARLVDFGIAFLGGSTGITGTGKLLGKSGFIAPEAYEGQPIDKRSDLFAFGATAYRLLTGVAPFRADNEAGMMRAVMAATPPSVKSLRPDVPKEVADLVAQCLEKSPTKRPVSIKYTAGVLRTAMNALTTEPRARVSALMKEHVPPRDLRALPVHQEQKSLEDRQTAVAVRVKHQPLKRRAWLLGAGLGVLLLVVFLWPRATEEDAAGSVETPDASIEVAREEIELPTAKILEEPVKNIVPEVVKPTPPRPHAPSAPQGVTLRIRVKPYAEVFLDGRLIGQTPVPEQKLEAGLHSIILVNNELGIRRGYQLRLKPGELRKFSADLTKQQ